MQNLYKKYIAWRFPYYKKLFKYRYYLKNYIEALEANLKISPIRLEFRRGYSFLFSNAAICLQMFDDIFVCEVYKSSYLDKAKIVIDIGSSFGIFSIYALIRNQGAQIFSIEADPLVFKEFDDNINSNLLAEQIKTFNLAANAKVGNDVLYSHKHIGWSSLFNAKGDRDVKQITVNTINLSTFCRENNITKIDFLKIDIESAEYDLILGDKNFFRVPIEAIVMEVDKNPRDIRYRFDDLIECLSKHYRSVKILSPGWKEYPLLRCTGFKG